MQNGIFIAGTSTFVGKTFIGSALCEHLYQKKISVKPFKIIESGFNNKQKSDCYAYHKAVDNSIDMNVITPYKFKQVCSTSRAAFLSKTKICLNELCKHIKKHSKKQDYLIIEAAGGILSPLCADASNLTFARKLDLPILLVTEDKLGCINDVLLNLALFKTYSLQCRYIVLNQMQQKTVTDDTNNIKELQQYTKVKIIFNRYKKKNFLDEIRI
jgi:dethiobiotin synthetase